MNIVKKLNYRSALVLTLFYFVLGGLWFSPAMFGDIWYREMGLVPTDPSALQMLAMFIVSLIVAVIINIMIIYSGVKTFSEGVIIGIILSLFLATIHLAQVFFLDKALLFVVNETYHLLSFVIMGGFFAKYAK